jgi:DNA repair photolyase
VFQSKASVIGISPRYDKIVPLQIRHAEARAILSATCGFIAQAGFTSLSPARNCTFACTYCYVPTVRIYGGLQPADWLHWGGLYHVQIQRARAARKIPARRPDDLLSPRLDPYQPAEGGEALMVKGHFLHPDSCPALLAVFAGSG